MTAPASSSAVSVTYTPADCGSIIPGKSKAPEAFRRAGLISKLYAPGLAPVEEHHALPEPARFSIADFHIRSVRNQALNIEVCKRVHTSLETTFANIQTSPPPFQLVIGGECCQLPAVLSALANSPVYRNESVGLIYIDGDLDLTSPIDRDSTGYFADMTTTHLLRLPGSLDAMRYYSDRQDGRPVCDAGNMVFFGTNAENPGNRPENFSFLRSKGFRVINSSSVASKPKTAAKTTLAYLQDKVDVIFVHLDVDSIDPQLFPLANVPNFTGVGFETMMCALSAMLHCPKVGGLMVAEVNPDHDPDGGMVTKLTDAIVGILASRRVVLGL